MPIKTTVEILTSAGAIYHIASTNDEFSCSGCGRNLPCEQVVGVMGPDNPFDEALAGSPLCANCATRYGEDVEAINRRVEHVAAPTWVCAVLGCETLTTQTVRSAYRLNPDLPADAPDNTLSIVTPICERHLRLLRLFTRTYPVVTIVGEFGGIRDAGGDAGAGGVA